MDEEVKATRVLIAGMTMNAFLKNFSHYASESDRDLIVKMAVDLTDRLIAELDKPKEGVISGIFAPNSSAINSPFNS